MLPVEYFIGLFLIGIFAGFASGLLGVGGGFLIVPLQYFLLEYMGISPDLAMLISLGTSLAIIIPTASTGAYRHSKSLNGIFKPGLKLGIFGIIGGIIGGFTASAMPSSLIRTIFGVFLVCLAIYNFLTVNKDSPKARIRFNMINSAIIGIFVGFLSGILGIGGGIFIIIILTLLLGYSLIEAMGISSVFISLTAIGGTVSYILSGWGVNTFPFSLGYVSIINFIGIAMFSIPFAYIGAKCSHILPEKRLKQVFALLILYMGLKMLGILF